jgi:hypothetical protein
VKLGDLIQARKGKRIGIVIEIFADLDPRNPWIRIRWTHPVDTYEWCKESGLELAITEENKGDP